MYELTDWGYDLRPVILALGRWGSHAPFPPGDAPLSPDAMMLALPPRSTPPGRTAWTPPTGCDWASTRSGFGSRGASWTSPAARADEADAVIATDTATLPELLWRDLTVEQAEAPARWRSRAAAARRAGSWACSARTPE